MAKAGATYRQVNAGGGGCSTVLQLKQCLDKGHPSEDGEEYDVIWSQLQKGAKPRKVLKGGSEVFESQKRRERDSSTCVCIFQLFL